MTVSQALKGLSPFPIPTNTIMSVGIGRGITLDEEATEDILNSKEYKLACADIYMFLARACSVSQGGQSYQWAADDKGNFLRLAYTLYGQYGDKNDPTIPKAKFGYKGDRL